MMKLLRKTRELKSKKRMENKQRSKNTQDCGKQKKDTVMVFAFPYSISKSLPTYTTRA